MASKPGKPDALEKREHLDALLLDEGLMETFLASDLVAVSFGTGQLTGATISSQSPGSDDDRSPAVGPDGERSGLMEFRLDYWKSSPQGLGAFRHLNTYIEGCGLEHSLLELVKTRASQINGCAYCLDMHTKDARAAGETEQRLYTLSTWREASFFSARERAALAWTEALTRISEHHVEDALYAELQQHFSEKEIVDLTLAVIAINGWNRLAIPFHTPAGTYEPRAVSDQGAAAS